MIEWKLISIPIIGFIIGYFTNYLAIKMLFYPKKPIFGFQGVLPKRRKELAKNIAEVSPKAMPEYIKKVGKIPLIGPKVIDYLKNSVEEEINKISLDELEKIVLKVTRNEMGFITWTGGILGFFIGLVQVGIMLI
ncbi:MAG: DUF445 family protein [Candidatus Pacearchaeota archaeon]|jgi:uncharacterized membrane protein YheB (UPF0754 family)